MYGGYFDIFKAHTSAALLVFDVRKKPVILPPLFLSVRDSDTHVHFPSKLLRLFWHIDWASFSDAARLAFSGGARGGIRRHLRCYYATVSRVVLSAQGFFFVSLRRRLLKFCRRFDWFIRQTCESAWDFFEVAEIYSRTSAFSIQHCVVLLSLYCMIVICSAHVWKCENCSSSTSQSLTPDFFCWWLFSRKDQLHFWPFFSTIFWGT